MFTFINQLTRSLRYLKPSNVNQIQALSHSFRLNNASISIRTYKSFIAGENIFAHQVLEREDRYRNTLINIEQPKQVITPDEFNNLITTNWSKKTKSEVIDGLVQVSNYALTHRLSLSDDKFDCVIEGVLRKCREFNYNELLRVFEALIKWPELHNLNNRNFGDLWSALDDMCLKMTETHVPYDKLLLLTDCWYRLSIIRVSDFVHRSIHRISRKLDNLTPEYFVQLMFYVNAVRRPLDQMYEAEEYFNKIFHKLSSDEVAIICMAYFKTQTVFQSTATSTKLMKRVSDDITRLNDVTLTAIMKMLRFSKNVNGDQLSVLLSQMTNHLDRYNTLSSVHMALAGTNIHMYNPVLMQKICEKIRENITNVRLKDLERITYVMATFNFWPKFADNQDMYLLIADELRKRDREISLYPKSLSRTINYFVLQNYYPHDLISRSLDPDFIKQHYGVFRRAQGRDVLVIDCSLDIEQKNYTTGNRLLPKWRNLLPRYLTTWPPKFDGPEPREHTTKQMWQVVKFLEEMRGGPDFVRCEHILPHFERADIVVCDDENGRPVSLKGLFDQYTLADIKFPPLEGLHWTAMVIGSRHLYIRNVNVPTGLINAKLRQLRLIGYNPIVIAHSDWIFSSSREARMEFLRKRLCSTRRNNKVEQKLG